MALRSPLSKQELPEEAWPVFVLEEQWQEPVPQKTREHKNRTMVRAICPGCNNSHAVPVNDVRNWIRGVRKQMPGYHRDCKFTGRIITSEGYIHIYRPEHPRAYQGKYVPEHILVMEENLGRYLDTKNESVHHINGDHGDNELSNLQLRTRYHGKGQVRMCNNCGSTDIGTAEL